MKITGVLIILLSCAYLGNGQSGVKFLESNCGVSISGSRDSAYRIVGGVIADKFGNPWMAFISSSVICGGSLITSRFVLSAAHCMTGTYTTVYLGEFDRSRSTENALQVPVDAQIPHPNYSKTPQDVKNDIGLFRLATTVRYTDFIRPICLPTNYNPLAQTKYLTATGWGKTEYGIISNVLKTTKLTQHNRGTCSSTFGTNVDMSQICAGADNSHTCSGDSGGPITASYPINGIKRVIQLGIVSYGGQYCETVGVYTNALHYIGWITNIVRHSGGSNETPTPTRRPKNNNPSYNDIYSYYTNPNSRYYIIPDQNSQTYYGNNPLYYYLSTNYPSYYYSKYYIPNYVFYG